MKFLFWPRIVGDHRYWLEFMGVTEQVKMVMNTGSLDYGEHARWVEVDWHPLSAS